jgi:ABC-type transport system involved in cytochrome c biogenesis ATPase subunit
MVPTPSSSTGLSRCAAADSGSGSTGALGAGKEHDVLAGMWCCRLPMPRPGQVLGLVGTNGIGKSTALKVLAGKLKPNLGRYAVSRHCKLRAHAGVQM